MCYLVFFCCQCYLVFIVEKYVCLSIKCNSYQAIDGNKLSDFE